MIVLPRSVELHTLEVALGGDGGGPGPVQHQGDLPEVVGGPEDPDLLPLLALVPELGHGRVPVHNDEEVVAGFALSHHVGPVLE